MISVNFQSNTEKGDQMRAIVHEQIDKLIAEGVSEDDVNDMILMMKKDVPGYWKTGATPIGRKHYGITCKQERTLTLPTYSKNHWKS